MSSEKINNTIEEKEKERIKESESEIQKTVPLPVLKTKEELIFNIKEWIKVETDIKNLTKDLKEKRNKMKELTTNLVNVMKVNSIDCFDINGGALVYKEKKSKKQISGKFLLSQLEEYFKDNQDLAKEIHKKVWDNRAIVTKEEIKREKDKK
jgi:phage gpG-like protein